MSSQLITLRIEEGFYDILHSISKERGLYVSVITKELIRLGLDNMRYKDAEFNKRMEDHLKYLKWKDAERFIKQKCREGYAFQNFKVAISKIKKAGLGKKEEDELLKASAERIKMLFGRDSEQYKGALSWIQKE